MAAGDIPQLDGVEHRYVDAGGLRVHVAEAGAGDPLVLVHGWPEHWYAWRKLIPSLAERYRVICPDLRGFGWTEATPGGYEKEALAGDLLALLDALELERVRLAGHDWGGMVGFLACLRAPERFERYLVLNMIHPWPESGGMGERLAAMAKVSYQFFISAPLLGAQIMRRTPFVKKALTGSSLVKDAWTDADLEIFAERWRDPARAAATVSLYRTWLTKELRPLLAGRYNDQRLSTPTLVLVGEGDPVMSVERMGGYESHADDLTLEEVPGAGHWTAEERPDTVLERMNAFYGSGARAGA